MSQSKIGTTGEKELAYQAALDDQIAKMRRLLTLMADGTPSAALGAMRRSFPDVPLAERVQALTRR